MRTFDYKTSVKLSESDTAGQRSLVASLSISVTELRDMDLCLLLRETAAQFCQVADENLDFVVKLSKGEDDIDKLLPLVNFVIASARRSLNNLHEAHRRIDEDLSAARELPEKLLPQKLRPAYNLRGSEKCVPARAVGGDFFDFFFYEPLGEVRRVASGCKRQGSDVVNRFSFPDKRRY